MKLAIVGTGYVGLVSGTCFADIGVDVTCIDISEHKIADLRNGIIPIYEPGLEEMILRNVQSGRLRFETDIRRGIDDYDLIVCAVGTPPGEDGSADLHYVLEVARTVGQHINGYTLFVIKSTVPVGTGEQVRQVIAGELERRCVNVSFDVASNPEFLKEGAAVKDFMEPDRVVVGVDSERARDIMQRLYKPFVENGRQLLFTDIASAEMIKYASNAMLATRISFMNEIANLCERLGADVDMVRHGMGADPRIGPKFLYPGIGYGGSCFPKDVKALVNMAHANGCEMDVLKAVESVNERQKRVLFDKFNAYFGGDIKGRRVAVWGLSFKPETDDMREAPSRTVIECLLDAGCHVGVYDPVAVREAHYIFGDRVEYFADKYEALEDADALMLVTEWQEFRMPDWDVVRMAMRTPAVFDGRNIYNGGEVRSKGIYYDGIGRN